MRGNIAQLMQQAQKMQENMQRVQQEIAALEVTGSAGGGMVSVTLSGAKECRKVRIDPSVLTDPEMAEDLIAAAFNDASNKIDEESKARMAGCWMPRPNISAMPMCKPSRSRDWWEQALRLLCWPICFIGSATGSTVGQPCLSSTKVGWRWMTKGSPTSCANG